MKLPFEAVCMKIRNLSNFEADEFCKPIVSKKTSLLVL